MRATIYGRLLLVLILCLVQSAIEAQQAPLYTLKWTTLPQTGLLMVRATLGDGKSRLFGVTPAQDDTALDRSLVKDLHLTVSTSKHGKETTEYVTSPLDLGPDGLYLPKVPFILADLTALRKLNPDIAGVIGINLLRNFTVRLDYSKQQMDLLPGSVAGTPYQPKDATRLTLTKADDQYYLKAAVDGKMVRFLIDTTGYPAYLCAVDLKSLKPKAVLKGVQASVPTEAGVKTVYNRLLRLNSLRLGGMTLDNPIFVQTERASDDLTSALRNDFFKRFYVVFDFPASTLYLTPDPSFREDMQLWVGIGLYMDQMKSNIVSVVYFPSPAEEAGLAQGDEIVSFEGHPLKGLSSAEVDTLMDTKKPIGTTITLEVRPANQSAVRTVKLQVRSLL
jgi:hypothetical protein